MKHRSKGRRKAPISRPSGGPVFVSPEDQKRMSLDKGTVRSHVHVLLQKLQVCNRTQAALIWLAAKQETC